MAEEKKARVKRTVTLNYKVEGLDKVLKDLDKIDKEFSKAPRLTVGIHEAEGAKKAGDGENDLTLAQIAVINHFGSNNERIPARPFLDVALEDTDAKEKMQKAFKQGYKGTKDLKGAMEALGVMASSLISKYILDLREPPNARSTIAAKGKDDPLVDEGTLARSITYQVKERRSRKGK